MQPTTIREALTAARHRLRAAAIEDPDLEAELLLRHALSASALSTNHPERRDAHRDAPVEKPAPVTRAQLFTHLDDPIDPAAAAHFDAYLARRLAHEPSAYITGHREFYGLDLLVTPATLIPRPETETLVEAAIELVRRTSDRPERRDARRDAPVEGRGTNLPANAPRLEAAGFNPRSPSPRLIADVGTGSGAIAVALAHALPDARVYATDISEAALAVATANARRHDVEGRIVFLRGDLLAPLTGPVDLIVANLPYVTSADHRALDPEVRDHEPASALDGGADGLKVIRRLLTQAPAYLKPNASLLIEFGVGQAQPLAALARATFPHASVEIRNDLAGRPRVLIVST